MTALQHWEAFFSANNIACSPVETNKQALSLGGLPGAPLFRAVNDENELAILHTKAREKSHLMNRLLILGLPFDHPGCITRLPGNIVLPTLWTYGGHFASSFSLAGHQIENSLVTEVKKEVSRVMRDGVKAKTPICDWLLKLTQGSWHYGKPSSKEQIDSLIALVSQDPQLLGHVRARQLTFGRGCSDALLLPSTALKLSNNCLAQKVHPSDLRLISLEQEVQSINSNRMRIHANACDLFLTVLDQVSSKTADKLGCGQNIGASVLGVKQIKEIKTVITQPSGQVNVSRELTKVSQ